ncbi:hypothetical protein L7F22_015245 [Adiantum nelumboides]|nr:hypothetical protein [Adiantum nelumboides]
MDVFLAEVKDLKEELIAIGKVITNHSVVQIVLDALPASYLTFASIVDDENSVPLFKAISEQRKALAKLLWEHGAYLPVKVQGGYLCAAAEKGDVEFLQSLLNYGADVNSGNLEGATALHLAVDGGWTEAVKLLLAYGAKADCCNKNGLTPVDLARQEGQKELLELLENPPKVLMSSKSLPKREPKSTVDQRSETRSVWPRNTGFKQLPSNKDSLPFSARVTLHPYHPKGLESNNNKAQKFLIPLPETWDILLKYLSKSLDTCPQRFLIRKQQRLTALG